MTNRRWVGCCGGSLVVGIVGIVALGLWVNKMCAVPEIRIPSVKLPNPNAFDYFAAAGKMVDADVNKIRRLTVSNTSKIKPLTDVEKSALVKKHKAALDKVRDGFSYEYLFPPRYGLDAKFPEYSQFIALASLLVMEGSVAEKTGNYGKAVDAYTDAIRLGVTMPRGTLSFGLLTGLSCENLARPAAWKTIGRLDAPQARMQAQKMESLDAVRFPFDKTLIEDKWNGLTVIKEGIEGKRSGTALNISALPDYGKRRVVVEFTARMNRQIADAKKPHPLCDQRPADSSPKSDVLNSSADALVSFLLPHFTGSGLTMGKATALNRLLAVSLALHAYRLENGRYPVKIDELAPSYLKKVPDDPFAVTGHIKYKLKGTSYVLYSVGPDGKDDGGRPALNPDKASRRQYLVNAGSKGDIVAGVSL